MFKHFRVCLIVLIGAFLIVLPQSAQASQRSGLGTGLVESYWSNHRNITHNGRKYYAVDYKDAVKWIGTFQRFKQAYLVKHGYYVGFQSEAELDAKLKDNPYPGQRIALFAQTPVPSLSFVDRLLRSQDAWRQEGWLDPDRTLVQLLATDAVLGQDAIDFWGSLSCAGLCQSFSGSPIYARIQDIRGYYRDLRKKCLVDGEGKARGAIRCTVAIAGTVRVKREASTVETAQSTVYDGYNIVLDVESYEVMGDYLTDFGQFQRAVGAILKDAQENPERYISLGLRLLGSKVPF